MKAKLMDERIDAGNSVNCSELMETGGEEA